MGGFVQDGVCLERASSHIKCFVTLTEIVFPQCFGSAFPTLIIRRCLACAIELLLCMDRIYSVAA